MNFSVSGKPAIVVGALLVLALIGTLIAKFVL